MREHTHHTTILLNNSLQSPTGPIVCKNRSRAKANGFLFFPFFDCLNIGCQRNITTIATTNITMKLLIYQIHGETRIRIRRKPPGLAGTLTYHFHKLQNSNVQRKLIIINTFRYNIQHKSHVGILNFVLKFHLLSAIIKDYKYAAQNTQTEGEFENLTDGYRCGLFISKSSVSSAMRGSRVEDFLLSKVSHDWVESKAKKFYSHILKMV